MIYRNEEKDYLSARANSFIVLICNIIALVVGSVVTLTIFAVVFKAVIDKFMEEPSPTSRPQFGPF